MKVKDSHLLLGGLAVIGIGALAWHLYNVSNPPPPVFRVRSENGTNIIGQPGTAGPIFGRPPADPQGWSAQHAKNPELLGGFQSYNLGSGHGLGVGAQPPSLRASTPTLIGGSQGYTSGSSGGYPAANPPSPWANNPGTFGY